MNVYRDLFKKCLLNENKYVHTAEGGDYLIEVSDETIYLFFEWSDGKEDWISNFNFPASPYKRMDEKWACHRGFLKVWKSMRDDIEMQVSTICKESSIKNIVCVGYSHGAAIALLATEDMAYIYGSTVNVMGYGFGCPRVCWGKIPRAVKNRLAGFRAIQNYGDIVTHVPPAIFGYRHINQIIIKSVVYYPVTAHTSKAYLNVL